MTAKEMIDDLLIRNKITINEHVAIQLTIAGERARIKEDICIQTGDNCGFPCYDKCPIYNNKIKSLSEVIDSQKQTHDALLKQLEEYKRLAFEAINKLTK